MLMQVAVWRRLQEVHEGIASLEEQKRRISAAIKILVVRSYRTCCVCVSVILVVRSCRSCVCVSVWEWCADGQTLS